MSNRVNVFQTAPNAYKAIMNLENYVATSGLTKTHWELIKIRASQINGCAYCLDMHSRDARKAGETEQRIYVLNAWRETTFFTEEEKAILALTEEVTLISKHVSDTAYNDAARVLGDDYLVKVIMAIVTINAWNRVAITTEMHPALQA